MSLYEKLRDREEKIAVVGLGYVGLPIAAAFAKKADVIGFDTNSEKITAYRQGKDPTGEIGGNAVASSGIYFTCDENDLEKAKFFIVAVPTPVNSAHVPDLEPVKGAARTVAAHLTRGSFVVFESTVYPGATEDVCLPILEAGSELRCGVDFKIGYSPERINPGDTVHRFENIKKVVSGIDAEALCEIKNIYDLVIEAGTYPVSSIKTAEAVKIAENSQRDINIAFMNELATVFDRMGIDTNEVVDGMNTKWNALGFRPGLVGGHCIGVDPYYFTYQAERLGVHSPLILEGRKVNEGMGAFIAGVAIRELRAAGTEPSRAKVILLGITFKENCPDVRNSKVYDIIKTLSGEGIAPAVIDPVADAHETEREYGVTLNDMSEAYDADCVIIAVAHDIFKKLSSSDISAMFKKELSPERRILIDVKGIKDKNETPKPYNHWRL